MPGKKDRKLIEKYCLFCGLTFETNNNRTKYCSADCRNAAKAKVKKAAYKSVNQKHIARTAEKSIGEIMCELDEYNRTHKTSLTYGQYVVRNEGGK